MSRARNVGPVPLNPAQPAPVLLHLARFSVLDPLTIDQGAECWARFDGRTPDTSSAHCRLRRNDQGYRCHSRTPAQFSPGSPGPTYLARDMEGQLSAQRGLDMCRTVPISAAVSVAP